MSKKHKSERLVEILTTNHVPLRVVLVRLTDYEEEVGKFERGVKYKHVIATSGYSHRRRDQFEVVYEGEESKEPYVLTLNSLADLTRPKIFAPRDFRELILGSRRYYEKFFHELYSDKTRNIISDATYLYILNKLNELYSRMMGELNTRRMLTEEMKILNKPQASLVISSDVIDGLGSGLETKITTRMVFGQQAILDDKISKRIIEKYRGLLHQDTRILTYLKRIL